MKIFYINILEKQYKLYGLDDTFNGDCRHG